MSADLIMLALRRHAVRLTPVRRMVLAALAQSPYALSSYELDKAAAAAHRPHYLLPHPAHV